MLPTSNIMGLPFINTDMSTLVDSLDERISAGIQTFLVTANPEIVMYGEEHPTYKNTLQSADVIIPDGIGIVLAAKMLRRPLQERLAGFDLMQHLLELAATKGYTIYCLGAKQSVIEQAIAHIAANHEHIHIAGYHHGYIDLDDEGIIEDIKATQPDIIFVGLGFPKQEQWIERYRNTYHKGLFIGVGGSFDVLAGEVKRAPKIWRNMNAEWLYRLFRYPSRWRRMLMLPKFLLRILRKKA